MSLHLSSQQQGLRQRQIPLRKNTSSKTANYCALLSTGTRSLIDCKHHMILSTPGRMSMACQAEKAASEGSAGQDVGLPAVSVLGIGLMGNKMARRLQLLGYATTAWNRDSSKSKPLGEVGCSVAESASDAINASAVVLLVLSDAAAIRSTILDDSAALDALSGKWIVQMGTIGPAESIRIAAAVEAAGGHYMEAPVLGSQPEVEQGTLLVMVGSKQEPDGTAAGTVLKAFCAEANYIGQVGTAAAVKLALNELIATLTVGFSTSLALLQKNGVEVEKFMSILRPSALYAPTFDKKLQRMLDRDFSNPNFPTKHLLKDVRLFQKEAQEAKIDTSLLEGLEKVIDSAVARGLDFTDYSAVHEAVSFPEGSPDA